MNISRLRLNGILAVTAIGLLSACAAARPALMMHEPPVVPPAEAGTSDPAEESGQETASLEMTVRGQALLDEGRLPEAVTALEQAIAIHSANPYAYYFLAKARFASDRFDQTLPLLGKAELYFLNDHRWLSWVYVLRGRTYEALMRWDEADGEYRHALDEDPGNGPAQEALGRLPASAD